MEKYSKAKNMFFQKFTKNCFFMFLCKIFFTTINV